MVGSKKEETYGEYREGLEGRRDAETREGPQQRQQKRHPENWAVQLPSQTSNLPPSDLKPGIQVYSTAMVSQQDSFDH